MVTGFTTEIERVKLDVLYEMYHEDIDLVSVYLANDVKQEVDIYDLLSDTVISQIYDEIGEHYYSGGWK